MPQVAVFGMANKLVPDEVTEQLHNPNARRGSHRQSSPDLEGVPQK